jgi:hypothetical protein
MADDTHHDAIDVPQGIVTFDEIEPAPVARRPPFDLGKMLAARPVSTAISGVAVGFLAIVLLDLFTDRARRRAALEQSALLQLRRAQRLEPYGDPLL